ncbi:MULTISPECIES: L,D-transpeptidase [unclassified Shinella]|uniref:L,D-transpeptidase family protein n=1 Tax=Shinella TaxID=323620 RepID=UPI00225D81BB|nr:MULTISPECIES: L,D-transpeptidase [unclassified Shinella]MCO5139984.1 L,D-transpeptidase [Shinella sp.]MDC7256998.1 L,D-transpeptidase [Shinella sp. YE25]CAI0339892.1 L,D-peptidoglycan transpeptidase YkuD (ErfK/YbiS/YcfS/YnhG family) [Rhizobiaceae bacterium]CAK7258282.1 L,D-peptidoglycan transpeptidase YkuD (ErfK/YbiS/YcfS/YnhG family) [Shinella sp. WSC3-e]
MSRITSAEHCVKTILVRPAPGRKSRAIVQVGPLRLPAAIGRSGRTSRKREGDGATPIAAMPLLSGFLRGDRLPQPQSALPLRRIRPAMLWCDAPKHPSYNRLVRAPFKPSHEEMQRKDELYDICLVLDWNVTARRRHAGSAIFFHLIRPGYEPTAGCIALAQRDMLRILPHLRRGTVVRVL